MIRITKCFMAAALISLCATSAFSQWTDGNGFPVFNPNSASELNPSFFYDPADGLFYVENVGPNGVVDSPDNATLLGDDIGLISILVNAPEGSSVGSVLPNFANGVGWGDAVIFNGKVQLAGVAIARAFLPISENPTPIFQLNAGLGVDDFRDADGNVNIEVGNNFSRDTPGATLFSVGDAAATGAFRVVPEPGSAVLMMTAGICLLGFRRRR